MSTKLYKINRRPRDALSDSEAEEDEPEQKYDVKSMSDASGFELKSPEFVPTESISIFVWPEYHLGPHYLGCLGQQSYSYATPNDLIVAYNYNDMDKDWFFWILKMNKLSPQQFLWIQETQKPSVIGVEKDEAILRQIAMIIEAKIASNPLMEFQIKPFMMFPETNSYINKIKSYVSDENKKNVITAIASEEWAAKFANKGCLHRYMGNLDEPSEFEKCGIFDVDGDLYKLGLRECKGYVCKNKEEILRAYDKLGIENVVIKECYAAGGDDISFWSSRKEIQDKFVWKDEYRLMNVEENLKFGNGHELERLDWIGRSFYDNKVIGCGCDNIIVDGAFYDGSKTYTDQAIDEKLGKIAALVMKKIGTKYMGGFDFAVQVYKDKSKEPRIMVCDMNTGRYTGVTQTFIVADKFEVPIKDRYFIRKTMAIKEDAKFKRLMDEAGHILFDLKTKRGAYFHMFGPSGKDSIVTIFGNDEQDANDMLVQLQNMEFLCE